MASNPTIRVHKHHNLDGSVTPLRVTKLTVTPLTLDEVIARLQALRATQSPHTPTNVTEVSVDTGGLRSVKLEIYPGYDEGYAAAVADDKYSDE